MDLPWTRRLKSARTAESGYRSKGVIAPTIGQRVVLPRNMSLTSGAEILAAGLAALTITWNEGVWARIGEAIASSRSGTIRPPRLGKGLREQRRYLMWITSPDTIAELKLQSEAERRADAVCSSSSSSRRLR